LVELTHRFNFFEGEEEILGKIKNEIAPPKVIRKSSISNSKAGQVQSAVQKKSDK